MSARIETVKRREYHQQWYLKNKAKRQRQTKEYYETHKDEYRERAYKWRRKNPQSFKQSMVEYGHSFNGHITRLWNSLKARLRVDKSYIGLPLEFDRDWFVKFSKASKQYKKLYDQWAESGFTYQLIPTVDRINGNLGYLKNNIQFLTHYDNNHKPGRRPRTKSLSE